MLTCDFDMRVPDEFTKCVGFVSRKTHPPQYGGTAFIVNVPYDDNSGCLHIVTAKHVAEQVDQDCLLGMNGKDGQPFYTFPEDLNWFYHPDESVDAAVLPFASKRIQDYDIKPIPVEMFATEKRISEYDIGIGDEIFVIGLFTKFSGGSRLSPILRTGNIAMMPKEKLHLGKSDLLTDASLIEGRSIGGLSGSPVFCRNTNNMICGPRQGDNLSGPGAVHLLGLMHGHWDLPIQFSEFEREEAVNMGISIVVPASKILQLLFSPPLVDMRNQAFQRSSGF